MFIIFNTVLQFQVLISCFLQKIIWHFFFQLLHVCARSGITHSWILYSFVNIPVQTMLASIGGKYGNQVLTRSFKFKGDHSGSGSGNDNLLIWRSFDILMKNMDEQKVIYEYLIDIILVCILWNKDTRHDVWYIWDSGISLLG